MNWKNRLTNYNFWISIVSAVLLILQAFEFQFDIMYINEIATAVLGLLVVIGIINDPTKSSSKKETTETKTNINKETNEIEENSEKVEPNAVSNTEVNEVKTREESPETNIESLEEYTFPIDEKNEITDDADEDDIKNLVDSGENDEKNKIKKMFENLLNLLKNNEKTGLNNEDLINFSQNEEGILEKTEISNVENFEKVEEIVEQSVQTIDDKVQNLEEQNLEDFEEEKIQNIVQPIEESEVQQASSFNIVN